MKTRQSPKYLAAALLSATVAMSGCIATLGSPSSSGQWLSSPAIYEVFTRDFSPEGTFNGITANLDRIQASGANVIRLMPVQPGGVLNRKDSPLDSSYSVRDYRALNPDYGTEGDFRRLVREVHRRGMKIIIDWVPNHTAIDHAMIDDMKYWLDRYNLDGFRVGVAGFVPDDFWREALPTLRAGRRPILLLAEWVDPKMHELGFDLSYGWDGYSKLKAVWRGEPAASFVEREMHERLPNNGRRLRFTTNHDETAWNQPPPVVFGGAAGARAAFVAMALLPGVPMLYNGQEVESPQKPGLFVKEPVAWSQPHAENARPFYRRVIELATSHPAFVGGELQPVITDAPHDVIAYARGDVVVLVNTRQRAIDVAVHGHMLNRARDLIHGTTHTGDKVRLTAYGTAVLDLGPR